MYTVYQTKCLINSKIYIGVHKTNDPNDDYVGSGSYLKRAIRKHGRENFEKEVLYVFETAEEAYQKEAELVTEELIKSGTSYNLKLGGQGGFDLLNSGSDEHRTRCILAAKKSNDVRSFEDRSRVASKATKTTWSRHGDRLKKNLAEAGKIQAKESIRLKSGLFSDETNLKRKKSFQEREHQKGEKNSSYGTMWITDGINNTKIKKFDNIPEGWYKGRVLKNKG